VAGPCIRTAFFGAGSVTEQPSGAQSFLHGCGHEESVRDLLSVFLALVSCFSSQSRYVLLVLFR